MIKTYWNLTTISAPGEIMSSDIQTGGETGLTSGERRVRLVRPGLGYTQAFCEMAEEFQKHGELVYSACLPLIRENFPAYLKQLRRMQGPRGLPAGRVPQSEFWLVDSSAGVVLGVIHFRHALTPRLEAVGGHIGYVIRPTERGKGYGKRILALLLLRLKAAGWGRVLLTCDVDNIASARVIEANGGRLEDQRREGEIGRLISRYWIDFHAEL